MLRNRFPDVRAILPVYAVIASIIYLWTLFMIIWQIPSWLLSFRPGEIASILAYEMLNCLVESLTFLTALVLIAAVLPPKFLKADFSIRASWISLVILGSLMLFFLLIKFTGPSLVNYQPSWTIFTISAAAVLCHFSGKIAGMRKAAEWVSDRAIIFLYIFIPASIAGLLTVLARNLF